MDPIAAPSPKGNATGGGKAWSEEEETYLVQKRAEKVAYKKIALQLNKTELACRLHFHQLQRGSNRRRRNLSISSSDGTGAMTPVYPSVGYAPASYSDLSRRSASPGSTPPAGDIRYRERSSYSPQHSRYHSLTQSPSAFMPHKLESAADIDMARLQKLVDHHKRNMWAAVAADYGEGATPDFLESVWSRQQGRPEYERKPTTPPTPMVSPRAEAEQLLPRGVSPHSHLSQQIPRKPTREGRPWELETPVVENKRYELFGPELRNGVSSAHHTHGPSITEMSRYTTERKSSSGSSHSSHRSISVESIISPTEVVMTRG